MWRLLLNRRKVEKERSKCDASHLDTSQIPPDTNVYTVQHIIMGQYWSNPLLTDYSSQVSRSLYIDQGADQVESPRSYIHRDLAFSPRMAIVSNLL
jgi:hypothetical protein